jgi:dTDP-3-amino-3,4,6-trideoxy-alpha-D-glucose transaminase
VRIPVANLKPALAATQGRWRAAIDSLLDASFFILGPKLAAFEKEFAAWTGAKHAIGVANGTNAIELCLRDAGVQGEVVTTALTAPFTAVAIRAAGCKPRFADIDPETLQVDSASVSSAITRKTKAIVGVHLYGQLCDLRSLAKIAKGNGALLIQDACQAHGARYQDRPLTGWSPYVCYSFYPTKNLGALGDGGAIATDRNTINRRLRMERDGGRGRRPQIAETWGINSRLDELQCCFLSAFLPHMNEWTAQRSRIASIYDEALRDCPGVTLIRRTDESVHHLYVVRARRRDLLRKHLAGHGIGTGIHYPVPLHLHPAFSDCGLKRGDLPHAERACRELVSLPLWPGLSDPAAGEVAGRIRTYYSR